MHSDAGIGSTSSFDTVDSPLGYERLEGHQVLLLPLLLHRLRIVTRKKRRMRRPLVMQR